MNIFYTHTNPYDCAKFLSTDRKRHNKMILESVQLLCSALIINGIEAPYKLTHKNHPCTIWAAKNKENFKWLLDYTTNLRNIYYEMYKVKHKSGDHLYYLCTKVDEMPDGKFENPPNCARNKTKGLDFTYLNINNAYREYLEYQWRINENNNNMFNM